MRTTVYTVAENINNRCDKIHTRKLGIGWTLDMGTSTKTRNHQQQKIIENKKFAFDLFWWCFCDDEWFYESWQLCSRYNLRIWILRGECLMQLQFWLVQFSKSNYFPICLLRSKLKVSCLTVVGRQNILFTPVPGSLFVHLIWWCECETKVAITNLHQRWWTRFFHFGGWESSCLMSQYIICRIENENMKFS